MGGPDCFKVAQNCSSDDNKITMLISLSGIRWVPEKIAIVSVMNTALEIKTKQNLSLIQCRVAVGQMKCKLLNAINKFG